MIVVFKKFIVILLSVVMLLSLGACGAKKKLNEKVAEKITEGVIEKATGGEAQLDIDKDRLTIKGKDGEEYSFGENEWPKGKKADLIPEFKKGKIVSVMNSDDTSVIILEEVEENDFKEYIEKLRDLGFTNNVIEVSSGEDMGFYANSNEETVVSVTYNAGNRILNISIQVN